MVLPEPEQTTHRDQVRSGVTLLLRKVIQRDAKLGQKRSKTVALSGVGRILKVDVDAIESVVFDKLDRVTHEPGALASVRDEAEVAVL